MVDEHLKQVLFVHGFAQSFKHTHDLRNNTSIGVDPSAFKDAFESLFEHPTELQGELVVLDVDDERCVRWEFRQCDEHGKLKQHLAFGFKP